MIQLFERFPYRLGWLFGRFFNYVNDPFARKQLIVNFPCHASRIRHATTRINYIPPHNNDVSSYLKRNWHSHCQLIAKNGWMVPRTGHIWIFAKIRQIFTSGMVGGGTNVRPRTIGEKFLTSSKFWIFTCVNRALFGAYNWGGDNKRGLICGIEYWRSSVSKISMGGG